MTQAVRICLSPSHIGGGSRSRTRTRVGKGRRFVAGFVLQPEQAGRAVAARQRQDDILPLDVTSGRFPHRRPRLFTYGRNIGLRCRARQPPCGAARNRRCSLAWKVQIRNSSGRQGDEASSTTMVASGGNARAEGGSRARESRRDATAPSPQDREAADRGLNQNVGNGGRGWD